MYIQQFGKQNKVVFLQQWNLNTRATLCNQQTTSANGTVSRCKLLGTLQLTTTTSAKPYHVKSLLRQPHPFIAMSQKWKACKYFLLSSSSQWLHQPLSSMSRLLLFPLEEKNIRFSPSFLLAPSGSLSCQTGSSFNVVRKETTLWSTMSLERFLRSWTVLQMVVDLSNHLVLMFPFLLNHSSFIESFRSSLLTLELATKLVPARMRPLQLKCMGGGEGQRFTHQCKYLS